MEPLRPWKREQIGRGYDVSCWIESEALSQADAIIAVSQDTKNDILNNFPVREEKIHIIPNGIDIDEYSYTGNDDALKKYSIDPGQPYLLFVGRITRQKGIIHLVDAIPYIDKDVQIVLCAGAPDTNEIKEEMENHIMKIKEKRNNIIWIPDMVDNKTKIELYSHASVFCCPSIYEPFGIINLEAMSCGVPVVATKTGGIPEIVLDRETGILVEPELDPLKGNMPVNPEKLSFDLAQSVNKIVRDSSLRTSMSEKSRRRASEIFSWKCQTIL